MNKRSGSLFLLAGLFGILYLGLASAATLGDALSQVPVLSNIVQYFENNSAGIALILLVSLVIIAVYSIASYIPIISDVEWVKWAFSIIFGILSFFYVDMATIKTILVNYEVVGVALTSIVPFLVLIVFSIQLEQKNPKVAAFVNPPLILIFVLYFGYKLWTFVGENQALIWVYLITLVLSLIYFVFRKWILAKYNLITLRATDKQAKDALLLEISLKIRGLQDKLQYASDPNEIQKINAKIAKLEQVRNRI